MYGSLIRIAAFAAICAGLAEAAAQQRRPIAPRRHAERWVANVPVGGGVRVGVMQPTDGRIQPDVFYVTLPPPAQREPTLCVEISSQDGRYSATLDYDIAGAPGGVVAFGLSSEHAADLAAYATAQMAILAALHKTCEAEPSAFLVASWRAEPTGDTIAVFLNSRLPTSLVDRTANAEILCTRLTGLTTAYNLRCDVPRARSAGDYVIRTRRNGRFTSLPLPLRMP